MEALSDVLAKSFAIRRGAVEAVERLEERAEAAKEAAAAAVTAEAAVAAAAAKAAAELEAKASYAEKKTKAAAEFCYSTSIVVKTDKGNNVHLTVTEETTVMNVRQRLSIKCPWLETVSYNLIWGGRALTHDTAFLFSEGVVKDDTLHIQIPPQLAPAATSAHAALSDSLASTSEGGREEEGGRRVRPRCQGRASGAEEEEVAAAAQAEKEAEQQLEAREAPRAAEAAEAAAAQRMAAVRAERLRLRRCALNVADRWAYQGGEPLNWDAKERVGAEAFKEADMQCRPWSGSDMVHEVCARAGIEYRSSGRMSLSNAQRLLSVRVECNAPPGEGLAMTKANITKEYHRMARLTHPDKNGHLSEERRSVYAAAFKAVKAASEVALAKVN